MSSANPTGVIAEDEPVLRAQMGDLLRSVWPELSVVAMAQDGHQALRALEQHRPDVLFLDIQMPGPSGMEVARQASGRCHVVFVTAYDHHAVAAFEAGAADYVMKPLAVERLAVVGRHEHHMAAPARRRAPGERLRPRAPAPCPRARPS
jgi:DNA-binding LytR/AlgR family response regulator